MKESNRTILRLAGKGLLFLFPFLLMISCAVILDPFKVFREYDDYYTKNFVSNNRELASLRLYERNYPKLKYDSFIFGSSRSLVYRVDHWQKYLPPGASGFHFDGSGDGIYGIYNKLRYIDETGREVRNALIVIDRDGMRVTRNRKSVLYISPPCLSKESSVSYYSELMKPFFHIRFVVGYFDYLLFRKYRSYMQDYFYNMKYDHHSDNVTNDFLFGYDRMISEDKEGYYGKLVKEGILYDRRKITDDNVPVTAEEIDLLKKTREILRKQRTNYRIVVSPCYNQIKLDAARIGLLREIFGKENVYDFSGVNRFTESIYNYYEDSHYRPHVANEILDIVYRKSGSRHLIVSRKTRLASNSP